MFKRIISFMLIFFLSLCLSTVYAATPKFSADKVVKAYAELYTFGSSENISITGLPKEYADEIKENTEKYLMLAFNNYPLNDENFETVQKRFFEKLHEVIKISAQLKVDNAENPVVELTINHIDQKAVDELKEQDGDFKALDVMTHMSEPQILMTDNKFQTVAAKSILNIIDNLPTTEPKTLDVTCKLIEYEGNFYWMPQDLEKLSKFVDPSFKIQEKDPAETDRRIVEVLVGPLSGNTNSTGE